jgi:hypothetical protein
LTVAAEVVELIEDPVAPGLMFPEPAPSRGVHRLLIAAAEVVQAVFEDQVAPGVVSVGLAAFAEQKVAALASDESQAALGLQSAVLAASSHHHHHRRLRVFSTSFEAFR